MLIKLHRRWIWLSATRDLKLNEQVVSAPDVHTAFLAALNGTYGRVVTADAIIAALQQDITNDISGR